MGNKQFKKARKYFDASVEKGQKKVVTILKNGGFDGINYAKTFKIDTDGGLASAPSAITLETEAGRAKMLGASATDFPTVDMATSTSMYQNGNLIGIGVVSNYYDAQKANNANSDEIVKKTILAYKKIEEFHNRASWGTDATIVAGGLLGFFNHPHIMKSAFETGETTQKDTWIEKKATEIVSDITDMIRDFYTERPDIREAGVTLQIHMSASSLDILTLKKVDSKTSVLEHLEDFLPKNRFKVEFVVTNALNYDGKEYVAIGDFRGESMSYSIPMTTEGMDTFEVGMTIRKNFVSESRGLLVEKPNTAIIYEGV